MQCRHVHSAQFRSAIGSNTFVWVTARFVIYQLTFKEQPTHISFLLQYVTNNYDRSTHFQIIADTSSVSLTMKHTIKSVCPFLICVRATGQNSKFSSLRFIRSSTSEIIYCHLPIPTLAGRIFKPRLKRGLRPYNETYAGAFTFYFGLVPKDQFSKF
jgi:hypothetical protein